MAASLDVDSGVLGIGILLDFVAVLGLHCDFTFSGDFFGNTIGLSASPLPGDWMHVSECVASHATCKTVCEGLMS